MQPEAVLRTAAQTAEIWPIPHRMLLAITRGTKRPPVANGTKVSQTASTKERYLSWLSLLPLRLNPIVTGRRSSAD